MSCSFILHLKLENMPSEKVDIVTEIHTFGCLEKHKAMGFFVFVFSLKNGEKLETKGFLKNLIVKC